MNTLAAAIQTLDRSDFFAALVTLALFFACLIVL